MKHYLRVLSLHSGLYISGLYIGALLMLSMVSYATPPGTIIDSLATVRFDSDGETFVLETSPLGNRTLGVGNGAPTRVTVVGAINFTVTSDNTGGTVSISNAVTVLPGQEDQVAQFSLHNAGNGLQDFLITAVNSDAISSTNQDLPTTLFNIFVEEGTTPGYQATEDIANYVDDLAPNATQIIYIVYDIPATANVDDLFVLTLVAQVAHPHYSDDPTDVTGVLLADDDGHQSPPGSFASLTILTADLPPTNIEVDTACNPSQASSQPCDVQWVFSDPAGFSAEDIDSTGISTAIDAQSNGQASDSVAFLVAPSPIVIAKSQQILSDQGPHSGATIEYKLDIRIQCRTEDIENIMVIDEIPPFTEFVVGSIRLDDSSPLNIDFNTINGVGYDAQNNRVVANFGTQPAAGSCLVDEIATQHTLQFIVEIQ